MPEEKLSLAKEQQKTKPQIEDAICELLDAGRAENALAFVAYLRENKLTPRWASTNAWVVKYKGKVLVSIRIGLQEGGAVSYGLESGSWHIGHWWHDFFKLNEDLSIEFEDATAYDEFKQFIWANVQLCKNCMCCAPGHDRAFFGKQFKSICNYRIENPNAIALEYTKKLLEFKKKATLAYLK